ncbi:4a-hydroxytetrahydrobiopterin dehydratase [Ignavibacterium sp.]|uniref:4a-hydroxytetrahydrobiopterin dehydratase n=1 Tax=Ignavibacterium sp. TaxID=2651167 RepID=UPI0021FE24E4|nr:4a-hydroxytetrahydrobiopterin dehydratase [Ignavibacterium sp.]BDQ02577.1 MAG: 4a-hydroxytetrahydrobiopterin dehydratase [Ignavibacterium sp.]
MTALTNQQILEQLKSLKNWIYVNNSISKEFEFKDFIEAMAFVNSLALEAEKMDHHPDILIYGWNKVKINLSTHSAGGVTEKDFQLAKKIEERLK